MTDTPTPEPQPVSLEPTGDPTTTLKDGFRTSEFWVAVAMFLVGLFLMSKGKDELGMGLITISGLGYKASRTLVKREPRKVS